MWEKEREREMAGFPCFFFLCFLRMGDGNRNSNGGNRGLMRMESFRECFCVKIWWLLLGDYSDKDDELAGGDAA